MGFGVMIEVTDKELRRLSRKELLRMLIAQMEENEKLKSRLKEAQAELSDRKIIAQRAGTMAEAALRLNGIFEDADRAAKQYLENIRRMAQEGIGAE